MTPSERATARRRAVQMLANHGIVLTPDERCGLEIADFGLNELTRTGLEILTYVNNERYCAKELVLFPGQTCPEHRHPMRDGRVGKQETFRCRHGLVYLNVDGEVTRKPRAAPPAAPVGAYTVFREIVLHPGRQYTLDPDTKHWFQAGPEGAIISEYSSSSDDASDIFTDQRIQRLSLKNGDKRQTRARSGRC